MSTNPETRKLYLAKTGLSKYFSGVNYSHFYVVARSADEVVQVVEAFLEKSQLGFSSERVVTSIELIAEDTRYPDCGTILIVCDSEGYNAAQ